MNKKRVWLDLETTGLNAKTNGIVELAVLIEHGGKIIDELLLQIKPFKGCIIEQEALDINGQSLESIKSFSKEKKQVAKLVKFLDAHGIYKRPIAGYNVQFDIRFLKQLLKRNGVFFTDYFNYYDVDVYSFVKYIDVPTKNKKLITVCEYFDIKLENSHNALFDIKATYELYKKLNFMYLKNKVIYV